MRVVTGTDDDSRGVVRAAGAAIEGRIGRIDRFERVISVEGGLDAALARQLLEIADRCPIHRTLAAGAAVVTSVGGGGRLDRAGAD